MTTKIILFLLSIATTKVVLLERIFVKTCILTAHLIWTSLYTACTVIVALSSF